MLFTVGLGGLYAWLCHASKIVEMLLKGSQKLTTFGVKLLPVVTKAGD